jgi:hypothetical protein
MQHHNSAAPYGPYSTLQVVGGVIWDQRDSSLVAHFDESSKRWYVSRDKTSCSTIVLTPA